MQYIFALSMIAISLLPATSIAASTIGFVDGLWFNTDTFVAEEPVRIYAAVRNHSGTDLTGTVTFFVDDKVIKRQTVAALSNRVIEAWADWTPTAGTHSIQATFSDITLENIGTEREELSDTTNLSATITVAAPPEPPPESSTGTTTTNTSTDRNPERQGIEAYLAPSRAQTALATITDWSSSTRATLETRREERRADRADSASTSEPILDAVSVSEATSGTEASTSPSKATTSILSDTAAVGRTLWHSLLDGLTALLITILKHPLLVQLLLLFGILYGTYRAARHFGRRP